MLKLQDLIDYYQSVYYLPDDGIIPLVCATIISNKLSGDPVWLMIVGPSSGGKSELINTTLGVQVNGRQFVHQISTITANAFLSGAGGGGKETSVLKKIGLSGVIAMKDFTSILSLGQETQIAVMSQLREIYDGHLVKETGTGRKLEWGPGGKLNLIAGTTEAIYMVEEKFSTLGPRWINYVLKEQDPVRTAKAAMRNEHRITEIRKKTQGMFSEYIAQMISSIPAEEIVLPEQFQDDLIELCTFVSIARSPVNRNFRGEMIFSISPEMPMRMTKECSTLARTLFFMNEMKMDPNHEQIIFKVALDSIPKQRMLALESLTKYRTVTTSGLAASINYPTPTVRQWLEDLNVRKIIRRNVGSNSVVKGDTWQLEPGCRKVMEKYKGIKPLDDDLASDDGLPAPYDPEFDPDANTNLADVVRQHNIDFNQEF